MSVNRREFIFAAGGAMVAGGRASSPAVHPGRFRAIAFDAFPIFDPRPIADLTESLFPGHGRAIVDAWRARQFQYQWLRALAGRYVDFRQATEDSLRFAAKQLQVNLSGDRFAKLMDAHTRLKTWPDAATAVGKLHASGILLAFVSNMTAGMLEEGLERADLRGAFAEVLSTDRIKSYKPDPRAYQMAVDALKLRREEILFVPFAGWDLAGAKWFGYPTFWVNRLGSPLEELGVVPDGAGRDLNALVQFVLQPGESVRS